jgi:AP-4 complex subunit epsilon-1
MTNAVNVEFIVDKLLSFLATSVDDHFRADLVNQISQCAERFAPSNEWYVLTIIRVFELAGDKVKSNVAQTLTQLIAEGADADEDDEDLNTEKDDELRKQAVDNFLVLLDKPKLPAVLAQTLAWVLGEYGYLSSTFSKESIMDNLCHLIQITPDSETKACIITALSKLIAQNGSCPAKVLQTITFYSQARSLDLQQRCLEILALLRNPSIMVDILPVDASCEDIEVDDHLSFLNDFVQRALNYGAKPYQVPISLLEDMDEDGSERKKQLKITPYATPKIPAASVSGALSSAGPSTVAPPAPVGPTPLGPAITNQQPPTLSIATAQGNQLIGTRGAPQVWGKKPEPPPPAPVPVAPAAPPTPVAPAPVEPVSVPVSQPSTFNNSGGMWGAAPTSTPAPAAPPAPKVLSEKEKMAAALFGGVGGASKAGVATKRKSVAETTSNVMPTSSPAPTVTSQLTSTAPNTPAAPSVTVSPTPAPASLMDDMDLLGLDVPSYPQPVQPAPSSSSANSMSLDQFETNLSAPLPAHPVVTVMPGNHFANPPSTPAPLPAPVHSSADLISDVFGGLDLSGGSVVLPAAPEHPMAPLAITTAEFGKRWGGTRMDAKQSISCAHFPRLDLESLRRAMPPVYHHVESIPHTQEAIFASTVTSIGAVILLHCKLNAARRSCDIILKCTSQEVLQKEVQHLTTALTNFRG